jgi:hypothetical protein
MTQRSAGSTSRVSRRVSRREFFGDCAACAGCAAGLGMSMPASATALSAGAPAGSDKAELRLVFSHITPEKPTWPYKGYDYEGRKKELTSRLRAACPNVEFRPVTVQNAAEAKKLLEDDRDVDGYVVYIIGLWTGAPAVFAASGKPTLLVDDLYAGSGEYLIARAAARREGQKVAGVASSRFEDVVQAMKYFETMKRLRSSVILDVIERDPGENAKAIQEVFGTTVRRISAEELNTAYEQADRAEARDVAGRWIENAERVVEPSRAEIEKSGAMYLAMQALMKRHQARAITVDCLGLFYGGKLAAYPCLGFFQFNNDGLVGACEADLQSTITMVLMSDLVGRPGYISDPVIDTAKNRIIYAHCVATNKVFGPQGPTNPYHIRDHSEDRKGAAVRSLMPLGETVTSLKFNPVTREVILHQARTVANIDEDKACRTKLAAEVRDVDRLLAEWDRWGWHRVTFYGDWKQRVETISTLLGIKMVEEG